MKQTTELIQTHPKKRSWRWSGAILLLFALAAAACSSTEPVLAPASTTPPTTTAPASTAPPTSATIATTDPPPAEAPPEQGPVGGDVDSFFDQLEVDDFAGVIAVREGADITTRAFGIADRENNVPVDAETVFDIGSISKQFTAAAILHLEMEGRLSVEDTLGEHVPGLPEDKAALTLHQLLTHTAGFPVAFGVDDEPIDRSDFLARVVETPLNPVGEYVYSNVGYSLLAAVIEFETEAPYEQYLQTALFEPAQMLDTGYLLPSWDGHTIAVGYESLSGDRFGRPNERPWSDEGPYWNLLGNGGILSTAADMLRWDEVLLGNDILDATAKEKFFAPHVELAPGSGVHYGYGWLNVPLSAETTLITHSGGNNVFFADFLRFVDQDTAVFLMTNSFEIDHDDLGGNVAGLVLGVDLESDDEEVEPIVPELPCGFVDIDSLPEGSEIDTLPDSPAGRTTQLLLDLLAEGDDEVLLNFAENYVSATIAGPTAIADEIGQLRDAGFAVTYILQQDDQRFHLVLQSPITEILLSLAYDDTDPDRLACVSILS